MATNGTSNGRRSRHAGSRSEAGSDGVLAVVKSELPGMRDELRSMAHDTTTHSKRLVKMAKGAAVHSVTAVRDTVQESATEATKQARQKIQSRPLTAVAVAAGIGAVVGGFLLFGRRK